MNALKEELRKHNINIKEIRWDLTPRLACGDSITIHNEEELHAYLQDRKRKVGYFFYINVWNTKANLCLAYNGVTELKTLIFFKEDIIPYDILIKAINIQGAINMSGWYPINEDIKKKLKEMLEMERNVIIDSVLFLALKGVPIDKDMLLAYLFLADKRHIAKYGRTVTEGYRADIPTKEELENVDTDSFDYLSDSDEEVLEFVIRKAFKPAQKEELLAYVKEYPEWKDYKQSFFDGEAMDERSLFYKLQDDKVLADIEEENLETAKKIAEGAL